jgi:hypothetical protein
MKKVILDFATTEVVRGSFGYDSYLLYSALKSRGEEVSLIEDVSPMQIHKGIGEESDEWIIHYWSYPQKTFIDWAMKKLRGKKSFIGYKPLIRRDNLPLLKEYDNKAIYEGMKYLPEILKEFKYGLMSDCDEHIKGSKMEKVMPLFLSYGCPNVCAFCPIPANRRDSTPRRVELDFDDCSRTLLSMREKGYNSIHFCDEDFFMNTDRAETIISFLSSLGGFKYIALASVSSFYKIVERVGIQKILDSGLQVVELGLETKDLALRKKMKKTGSEEQLQYLLNIKELKDKIFFLSVSLFPGETLESVEKTGAFLKQYGPTITSLTSRVKANSSVGGLGQFFQHYTGCIDEETLAKQGKFYEKIFPTRLEPSFAPYSLLKQKPKWKYNQEIALNELFWWRDVYNLDPMKLFYTRIDGSKTVDEIVGNNTDILKHILLLARLGKLES